MMEPPAKRPRLAFKPHFSRPDDDDDDELNFEPEEISRRRDPGYLLQQERAVAADRLKSTFEHIFEKYERDFSEIGDEIDLRTGEIIVNRGHLEAMRNEKDVGDEPDEEEDEDEGMLLSELVVSDSEEDAAQDGDSVDGEEEDRILQGRPSNALQLVGSSPSRRPSLPTPVRLASQHRLSHLAHSRYTPMKPSPLSRGVWEIDNDLVEPAWRTPQLPRPSFPGKLPSGQLNTIYQLPAMDGSQSVWASESGSAQWPSPRRGPSSSVRQRGGVLRLTGSPARKLLPAPSSDEDDEDEILMGSSHRAERGSLGSSHPPSSPTPGFTTTKQNGRPEPASSLSKLKKTEFRKRGPARESSESQSASDTSGSLTTKTKRKSQQNKQETVITEVKKPRGRPRKRPLTELAEHPLHAVEESSSETETSLPQEAHEQSTTSQTLIVAIPFRKAPTPDSLTMIDDTSPHSVRRVDALPTPPLQDSEDDDSPANLDADLVNEILDALKTANSNLPGLEESTGNEEPLPPVETFSRNEIDPSYEFSDEDDIPTLEPLPKSSRPVPGKNASSGSHSKALHRAANAKKLSSTRKRKRLESPSETDLLEHASDTGGVDGHLSIVAPNEVALLDTGDVNGTENTTAFHDGFAPIATGRPPVASPNTTPNGCLERPTSRGRTADDLETTPRRSTRQALPLSLTKVSVPSPVPSDDSLGAALDDIIASQKLFEDFDQGLDSPPRFAAADSPSKQGQGSSPRKRRRSVRFMDEDIEAHEADSSRPRIISTPPLTKKPSLREEPLEIQNPVQQRDGASSKNSLEGEATVIGSSPHQDTSVPKTGGMFAANRARRGKRASLPSTPEIPIRPTQPSQGRPQSSTKKKPFIKRRSLLSITLDDGDGDEDPLNAMSLLTYWTSGATTNSPEAASTTTPAASRRAGGPSSMTRKRIAREGFGGLTTPTKKRPGSTNGSPSGSVIHTLGGHVRRCGVNGYSCEKDFCFTCLGG